MFELVVSSLYFILPAYIANIFPVLLGRLGLPFGTPISTKWLGSHKTWRGIYSAYLGALIMLAIQLQLLKAGFYEGLLNYQEINIFFYAFLLGIGAITGDAVKSFFKRRIGIKPGRPFFPFDQLDFVIGALLFCAPFYFPPWQSVLTILIATPLLHLATNIGAYFIGLKKVWW